MSARLPDGRRPVAHTQWVEAHGDRPTRHGVMNCAERHRFTCQGCGNLVCWCVGGDGCVDERNAKCEHVPRCGNLCSWCWVRKKDGFPLVRRPLMTDREARERVKAKAAERKRGMA